MVYPPSSRRVYPPLPSRGYPPLPSRGYPPLPSRVYPPLPNRGYPPLPSRGYPPLLNRGYPPQPTVVYPPYLNLSIAPRLRHRLQAFPTDIPGTVFGETGVLHLATVPTGTHQGDGCQQTAITRQVATQAAVLIVVSVL